MKNENGITILALVITITIMAIISLTVFFTAEGIDKEVDDDVLIAELKTVHHIVLQEYNKKLTLGDDYNYINKETTAVENIGETYDELGQEETNLNQGVKSSKQISFIRKTTENGVERYYEYYELTPDDFKLLGAKNVSSTYLVCYETGEVANITKYKTSGENPEPLYTK